jgi:hypothetical protein
MALCFNGGGDWLFLRIGKRRGAHGARPAAAAPFLSLDDQHKARQWQARYGVKQTSSSKAMQQAAQQAGKQRNSTASKQGKAARKRGSTARQVATTSSKAVANGVEEGQYSARTGKRERWR